MHPIAAVPAWVWATLLMAVFVLVSAATMWLARYAIRQPGASSTTQGGRSEDQRRD